jgi:two-component system, NtrC family, nitrogen regulation sensor histidine kinase NtrY
MNLTPPKSFIHAKKRIFLGLILVVVGGISLALLNYLSGITTNNDEGQDNVSVFLFVNFNVLFLFVCIFLVARELIKLYLDRRKGLLGAKLKLKLIVPFFGLIIAPLLVLFFFATQLLNRVLEEWLSNQAELSHLSAIKISRSYYKLVKSELKEDSEIILKKLKDNRKYFSEQRLNTLRKSYNLFSIKITDLKGKELISANSPLAHVNYFNEPSVSTVKIKELDNEKKKFISEDVGDNEARFLRFYTRINKQKFLILSLRLNPSVTEAFVVIKDSYHEYKQIKLFKKPLKSSYLLTLALISAMMLFAVLWLAVNIAKGIVEPIERLVIGTQKISSGDYTVQLEPAGEDEVGLLVNSFNKMASDLKSSQAEAESQRILLEAIVANLTVGVIAIRRDETVLMANRVACSMLNLKNPINFLLLDQLRPDIAEAVSTILKEVNTLDKNAVVDIQFSLVTEGQESKLVFTATKIFDYLGEWITTIILFDDITEISKAQQMSAWREVARRIAHEIKNPLTPLKLAAQRLERRVADKNDRFFQESTQTIVEHVESIKRLADEFSKFARMPTAVFSDIELNHLITELLPSYVEANHDIQFNFISDSNIGKVSIDPEQIRRVLINILDNSVAAIEEQVKKKGSTFTPKITIRTSQQKRQKKIIIEVCDNGIGIPPNHRQRIFDPYFTNKKGGTGLGLAIATSVIAEHDGTIRAEDNSPYGTKIIIELPFTRKLGIRSRY